MKMDDLNCSSSSYLTIFQCSFDTYIDSGCTNNNSYVATVSCCEHKYLLNAYHFVIDTTRIWNSNPFSGMIRLQGGSYPNEGCVEVYCNGQWGKYVMMDLVLLMLVLFVNNWDITITTIMIISVCKKQITYIYVAFERVQPPMQKLHFYVI